MTEAEWQVCSDPIKMLRRANARTSERKLRLFACGVCRLNSPLLSWDVEEAVSRLERAADGAALSGKPGPRTGLSEPDSEQLLPTSPKEVVLWRTARWLRSVAEWGASSLDIQTWYDNVELLQKRGKDERLGCQCSVLRDLFGPVCFRSVPILPAWLAWNDGTVVKIARAIYDDRAFDRIPILADALEDAGCDNADLLNHCRQPGEHVRGCWVVDLILGKE
jgi:hypothetical protein